MNGVTISVVGAKETIIAFGNYSALARNAIGKAIERCALRVEADAKRLCPVDTGDLRRSIHSTATGPYSAKVFDGRDYGVYQEYGTSKMKAQPFMRPAVDLNRPKFEAELVKAVEKVK